MSKDDLTVDEKMGSDAHSAKLRAAEKHFYDQAQPFFPMGFSIGVIRIGGCTPRRADQRKHRAMIGDYSATRSLGGIRPNACG